MTIVTPTKHSHWTLVLVAISVLFASTPGIAQQRGRGRRGPGRVYKTSLHPRWFDDSTGFWYSNDLRDGTREYVVVDAVKGIRRPAFDPERLAGALQKAGVKDARADRPQVDNLVWHSGEKAFSFRAHGGNWRCDLESYELSRAGELGPAPDGGLPAIPARNAPRASTRTGAETWVTFVNKTSGQVELRWVTTDGGRRSYGNLAPGEEKEQHTFAGHVWEIADARGEVLVMFRAEERSARAVISGKADDYTRRRRPPRQRTPPSDPPPERQWTASVRDNNVFLRSKEDGTEHQVTRDGTEDAGYGMVEWAPDSKTLVVFRIRPGDRKEVHLVESSPREGGRARLHTRPYPLPGDKFTSYELHLIDAASRKMSRPDIDVTDFGRPRLRWNGDGRRFTYEKTDRGHQRFRLIEVDTHTGDTRSIIDEKTDTFIWTAHTENVRLRRLTWLNETNEIVYASERDGWRHLYLVDPEAGKIKNQITRGEYVVRAIDRIDEEQRQIWFRACGRNPDQDPYLIHYYRVNFDGSKLVALTEGNGYHSLEYSPDGSTFIDAYSRVDQAPIHELRRTSDGKLLCRLEEADTSELEENGWKPPEVLVAKGRDGKTDIWGILCRPRDFDPDRKYPVIEEIYAGPQSSYVPKTFSTARRYSWLTDLGFVVVKMDGMGTANRSKAFHDVCWKNLKDAGFPDRILWMRAAAEKYPWMDITRVGVYGNSAGGQNATGAVLFHPEFYKAAVASCGCHDNRMDKASWNEQWMGYPVGPQYSECSNIDNAHRLEGHLLLIVGEMDRNVPPESTMRLADALIRARKDFDLLVIPGGGHGSGGSYGQQRMQDFFQRHLQGVEPPNRNVTTGG